MKERDDILSRALQAVDDGRRVAVSLTRRSITVDGEALVDAGRWEGSLGVEAVDESTALSAIEKAYASYESSVPDFGDMTTSRWFHARSVDEMSDAELVEGDDRATARCRLEVLTLAYILNGSLRADGSLMCGKWFWQSEKYRDLVLLTEWMRN